MDFVPRSASPPGVRQQFPPKVGERMLWPSLPDGSCVFSPHGFHPHVAPPSDDGRDDRAGVPAEVLLHAGAALAVLCRILWRGDAERASHTAPHRQRKVSAPRDTLQFALPLLLLHSERSGPWPVDSLNGCIHSRPVLAPAEKESAGSLGRREG